MNLKKIPYSSEPMSEPDGISLTDCLMSGLAVFGLKFPSLLKFDECKSQNKLKHNLQQLYLVNQTPCDTYMRERCDIVEPRELRKAYKKVFACVQRGKVLEEFEYLDKHYLLAGDGTGFFNSHSIHCENCCIKHHKKCHIQFVLQVIENTAHFKKRSYLLCKNAKHPWELWYINEHKQKVSINIALINGLQEILMDKPRKALTGDERKQVRELVTLYYYSEYPEEDVTYYHNMFCAAIVHPDKKIVLALAPEPIMKTDGSTKNDCEQRASRRLYADARREHPHLKFIVVEDSLGSNVPHLSDLKAFDMRYIIGVKPGDHQFLFALVDKSPITQYSHSTNDGTTHRYRYINQVQLNKSHPDFKVNFLEYWETDKHEKQQHFSWVTDIAITDANVYQIMRGGRANWRIENNTFNTLKNQDYHFSHNFGHGYQNLSTVFSMLMMLAFFVDQVQELSCYLFKEARSKFKSRTSLWEKIRSIFNEYFIESWDDLFQGISKGYNEDTKFTPNTS